MRDTIHYLVRDQDPISGLNKLFYPLESRDGQFHSYGNLYIMGRQNDSIEREYTLFAVLGDEMIKTQLRVESGSVAFVSVPNLGIGNYEVQLETTYTLKYGGLHPELSGLASLKRIRLKNHKLLNKLAEEKNFYFTGYSPFLIG